jgi:hypothetical protein
VRALDRRHRPDDDLPDAHHKGMGIRINADQTVVVKPFEALT